MSFFQYNNEKPPAVIPIFAQKTSNMSKIHYIMGQKVNGKNKHNFCQYNTGGGWEENWWINLR